MSALSFPKPEATGRCKRLDKTRLDRNQRDTLLVPNGGNRVLEKTHGAGKIEGRR